MMRFHRPPPPAARSRQATVRLHAAAPGSLARVRGLGAGPQTEPGAPAPFDLRRIMHRLLGGAEEFRRQETSSWADSFKLTAALEGHLQRMEGSADERRARLTYQEDLNRKLAAFDAADKVRREQELGVFRALGMPGRESAQSPDFQPGLSAEESAEGPRQPTQAGRAAGGLSAAQARGELMLAKLIVENEEDSLRRLSAEAEANPEAARTLVGAAQSAPVVIARAAAKAVKARTEVPAELARELPPNALQQVVERAEETEQEAEQERGETLSYLRIREEDEDQAEAEGRGPGLGF